VRIAKTAVRERKRQQLVIDKTKLQAILQSLMGYGVRHLPHAQSKLPIRDRLEKFIQTKKALPTIFLSGTNPQ
jgi:hypothetical protein